MRLPRAPVALDVASGLRVGPAPIPELQENPVSTLALLAPLLFTAAAPPPQDLDAEGAAAVFELVEQLAGEDAGALWGVELGGPLLLLDRGTGRLAANRPDPGGRLVVRDGVHQGERPPGLGLSNSAQVWQGVRWTTVVWPLPADPHARRRLLAHELFHRIQPDVPLSAAANPDNPHLDSLEGRLWLRLEWRALAAALRGDGEERRRALTDALAFRGLRQALFPGARVSEAALELNEGLAEYTGWRLGGLPRDELAGAAAGRLLGEERGLAGFVRSFAYASGPAYALLLDAADPGDSGAWRRETFDDLAARTARAFGLELSEPDEPALVARAALYGFDEVVAEEEERALAREERLELFRARFVDGPVLELEASPDVRYTFDPTAVESFEGYGQVHETLELTDSWGTLRVTSGGALLMRDEADRPAAVRVPAPTRLVDPVAGPGYTLELAEGWVVGAEGARRRLVRE